MPIPLRILALTFATLSPATIAQVVVSTTTTNGETSAPITSLPGSAHGSGTITGHVLCTDTQRSARFATVILVPKPEPSPAKPTSQPEDHTQPKQESRRTHDPTDNRDAQPVNLLMVKGTTDINGNFSIGDLPPGDYFVLATMPGYVLPLGKSDTGSALEGRDPDVAKILRDFPVVHVEPGSAARADLSIERGAVFTGHLTYDDGSPASSVYLDLAKVTPGEGLPGWYGGSLSGLSQFAARSWFTTADDAGAFRLIGIQPGKYILSARIQMQGTQRTVGNANRGTTLSDDHSMPQSITLYYPGVFRRTEAKVLEVKGGETQSALDIPINLQGLHTVRGRVLAQTDRHPLSHSQVFLTDNNGFSNYASVSADGAFEMQYVPDGTFTLHTSGVDFDADHGPASTDAPKVTHFYAPYKHDLLVEGKDVVLDDILLPEVSEDKMEELMGQP